MKRLLWPTVSVLLLILCGCGPNSGSAPQNAGGPPGAPEAPPTPEEQRAVEAAAKFGGYKAFRNPVLEEQPLDFQFHDAGPKDEDLEALRPILEAVPRGVGLNLNQDKNITDAGVAKLKGMANLKSLQLSSGPQVTPKCLEDIKTLKNLEYLVISCKDISDADMAQLAGLTKLRGLDVHSDKLTDAGLAPLKDLTEMRQFSLGRSIGDAGMDAIKGWTKLEVFDLIDCEKLTDAGAANLKNFTGNRSTLREQ